MDRARWATGLVLAAMSAIGACQSAPSQPAAEAAVCASLAALGGAVDDFAALTPGTASVDDVKAAKDAIGTAWNGVRGAVSALAEADAAAVDTAWNGLSQAVDDIPSDVPIDQAISTVKPAADDVRTAYGEMRNGLGCTE
jgi:hypothetical protein